MSCFVLSSTRSTCTGVLSPVISTRLPLTVYSASRLVRGYSEQVIARVVNLYFANPFGINGVCQCFIGREITAKRGLKFSDFHGNSFLDDGHPRYCTCIIIRMFRRFERTICLHIQGNWNCFTRMPKYLLLRNLWATYIHAHSYTNDIFTSTNYFGICLNQIQSPRRWRQHISSKRHNELINLHGVINQKTVH